MINNISIVVVASMCILVLVDVNQDSLVAIATHKIRSYSCVLMTTDGQTKYFTRYTCSLVPRPSFLAALDVLHHQRAERKGLETLARFLCALEEFA